MLCLVSHLSYAPHLCAAPVSKLSFLHPRLLLHLTMLISNSVTSLLDRWCFFLKDHTSWSACCSPFTSIPINFTSRVAIFNGMSLRKVCVLCLLLSIYYQTHEESCLGVILCENKQVTLWLRIDGKCILSSI